MRRTWECSRRSFLNAGLALGGAALAGKAHADERAPRGLPGPAPSIDFRPFREPGRVVQVFDPRALARMKALPRAEPVEVMVARALTALTGKASLDDAFGALFHPNDVVGIKPNCLAGRFMSTNKEVLDAVVAGLVRLGVKPGNIVVWEQSPDLLRRGRLPQVNRDGEVRYTSFMTRYPRGYFGPEAKHGAGTSRYCDIVHRVSAIINLPVFKDHSIAGITVSMKNLTHGTIDNPFEYHHEGSGEIAHIYAHPVLAAKTRLTLADALRVQFQGGPFDSRHKVLHHSVYASTDPVAIDSIALSMIESLRRAKGLPALARAGRAAKHVEEAQGLGLGVAETSKIRAERITLS